jgi:acetyl-CoA/propionyl-CoA carboxylase biotin carboxyl carrier protein
MQRRHQKVIEESPAAGVDERLRRRLGQAALALAAEAGYVGAGTAEFLLADDGTFAFLELNARLQVEHPVTEAVTGIDLVEQQLRIAGGQPLGLEQRDVALGGHAIEARLYAEDPWAGFLPATGTVLDVAWPSGEGIRVDAGVARGDRVGTRYDPLLAKIVAHGPDRATAVARLDAALADTLVLGVTTNRGFLRTALAWPEFAAGNARTDLIAMRWHPDPALPAAGWEAAAAALADVARSWQPRVGFRLNAPPSLRVRIGDEERRVAISSDGVHAWRSVPPDAIVVDVDGRSVTARLAPAPTVAAAVEHASRAATGAQSVTAAMPGVVLAVRVTEGEHVETGDVLVVLEAMKMENAVTAPSAGRVERVLVRPGAAVQRGDALVEIG